MIAIEYIRPGKIVPNPWNPNRQNEAEYEAEKQSIQTYGFIAPVIVRSDGNGGFQMIDGEHRHRVATELGTDEPIPTVVLDVTEDEAKKLTVVLNETRGRADPLLLGKLFADLAGSLNSVEDLLNALPFDQKQVEDFIGLAEFDWSSLQAPSDDKFDGGAPDTEVIRCALSTDDAQRFVALSERCPWSRPDPGPAANGIVLRWLMDEMEGKAWTT